MFALLKAQDIHKTFIEELKDARIPYKECPDVISLLIEFSRNDPSFGHYKVGNLILFLE